jgi:hypothetical protein
MDMMCSTITTEVWYDNDMGLDDGYKICAEAEVRQAPHMSADINPRI